MSFHRQTAAAKGILGQYRGTDNCDRKFDLNPRRLPPNWHDNAEDAIRALAEADDVLETINRYFATDGGWVTTTT